MDNENLLWTLSKNAQEDIKKYSVEKVVDLWGNVFCKIKLDDKII